jgi:hypothetical protein
LCGTKYDLDFRAFSMHIDLLPNKPEDLQRIFNHKLDEIMPRKLFPPSVKGGARVRLRRKQLDELAASSALALSPEQEVNLQEVCSEFLISAKFERKGGPGSSATRVYESLISELGSTVTTLSDILGQGTPQHYQVHGELDDHIQSVAPEYDTAQVLERIAEFQQVVVKARDDHVACFGGPGRPMKNESLRAFIWSLADLFEAAGGKARVTYEPIEGRLRSPFLTWVKKINTFLPSKIRASATALPDLVREICRLRNGKARRRKATM